MQSAADAVGGKPHQVERLLNDALAGERGVAVNQQCHAALALGVAAAILLGAHAAGGDGGDELEMAWIEAERKMHFAAARELAIAAVAEMIFDVAAALLGQVRRIDEFPEHVSVLLSDHVDQDVEPAAMGHGENNLPHSGAARSLNRELQERDQTFRAFQRKTFRADELAADEFVESIGIDQIGQNVLALGSAELEARLVGLDSLR